MALGGEERTDSVRAGLAAMPPDVDVVLVHDAARCFVHPDDVEAVARAAYEHVAPLLATRVRDTLKHSANGLQSEETVDRDRLWAAETPQAMRTARFHDVLARARLRIASVPPTTRRPRALPRPDASRGGPREQREDHHPRGRRPR